MTGFLLLSQDSASARVEPSRFAEPAITQPVPARKAAKQAAERLNEITKSIGVQTTSTFFNSKDDGVIDVFGFTSEEMSGFRIRIEQDRSMECPVEVCICWQKAYRNLLQGSCSHTHTHTHTHKDCKRTFTSYQGLKYHLKRHGTLSTTRCPQCKRILSGKKRLENHLRSKHPDVDLDVLVGMSECE